MPSLAWLTHPSAAFVVDVVEEPPCLILRLRGELDFACLEELGSDTGLSSGDVTEVHVHLDELEFCDVAGLRAVHRLCVAHTEAGRDVKVLGARPYFRKIAKITGLVPQVLNG